MAGPLYGPQPSRQALARERLAQALLGQGMDASPIQHPLQGIARLAQAYFGSQMLRRGEEDEKKREGDYASGLNAALLGATDSGMIADRLAGSGNPDLVRMAPQFRVSQIESNTQAARDKAKAEAARALKQWEYKNDPNRRYKFEGGSAFDLQGQNPLQPAWTKPKDAPAPTDTERLLLAAGYRPGTPEYAAQAKRLLDSKGAPPAGSQDARDDAILFSPNADPSSPEYQAAYYRRTQPRVQTVPGPDGQPVMSAVTPTLPPNVRQPGYMQQQATPPQTQAPVAPAPASAASGAPQSEIPPPTNVGGISIQPIAPPKAKDLTESQAKANQFGALMEKGHNEIEKLQVPGATAILAWRNLPEGAVNMALPENDQKYFNSLRTFAAGILRKETGASFGKGELEDVQSRFFPMPGDTPAVIAQKAASRVQAISSMKSEIPGGTFRGVVTPKSGGDAPPPPPGFKVIE